MKNEDRDEKNLYLKKKKQKKTDRRRNWIGMKVLRWVCMWRCKYAYDVVRFNIYTNMSLLHTYFLILQSFQIEIRMNWMLLVWIGLNHSTVGHIHKFASPFFRPKFKQISTQVPISLSRSRQHEKEITRRMNGRTKEMAKITMAATKKGSCNPTEPNNQYSKHANTN